MKSGRSVNVKSGENLNGIDTVRDFLYGMFTGYDVKLSGTYICETVEFFCRIRGLDRYLRKC